MIVTMCPGAAQEDIDRVVDFIQEKGLNCHFSQGESYFVIGVVGDVTVLEPQQLEVLPGVDKVVRISQPFKLASREFNARQTVVEVRGVEIGGPEVVVMAGPCAVESQEGLLEVARAVKRAGARILRGGAFKPRTSPYSFQGLEEEGLKYLAQAREETGLPVITEVTSPWDVDLVARYADILQIGTRNAQNFALLREVGKLDVPVMLKRGMMSSVEEWLMAAEYILSGGNRKVILCERGIRTFEKYTRNTLDLSAVPLLKSLSHLPVVADPSHGTGLWKLVGPMAKAAVAAGADGLMVEVHQDPKNAFSDGFQSLTPDHFSRLMQELKGIVECVGRTMEGVGQLDQVSVSR